MRTISLKIFSHSTRICDSCNETCHLRWKVKMGMTGSLMYNTYYAKPHEMPNIEMPPTFDPMYGFPDGRKPREMIATEAQMEAAGLPLDKRDYCAHHLIDYQRCRQDKFPFYVRCEHEKHVYDQCEYQDWILRMKEYERERRLLGRAAAKKRKELAETIQD